MSREGIKHPRTSMTKHGCQSAVFMITGHKDKRIWIYIMKKKGRKVRATPFSGLHTYLGLRIRPNVALACLLLLLFF